jgi:hypothetical protein
LCVTCNSLNPPPPFSIPTPNSTPQNREALIRKLPRQFNQIQNETKVKKKGFLTQDCLE